MAKVIVKWESNYADEMDISGFVLMDKADANIWKKKIKTIEDQFTIYVGTNEDIEYGSGEELLSEIKIQNISDAEYEAIINAVGKEFGFTNFLDAVENFEEDEEN